jgi:DNA-binding MarR family transcriptional regulator
MTAGHRKSAKVDSVASVREFNRFYTKQIGVLQEGLLESSYSLTEARIMYELAHGNATTASELADLLGIDRGYLSRILKRFKSLGFVERTRSRTDGREFLLRLTSRGRRVYAPLNERANREVKQLLKELSAEEIRKLLAAMATIRRLLGRSGQPTPGKER